MTEEWQRRITHKQSSGDWGNFSEPYDERTTLEQFRATAIKKNKLFNEKRGKRNSYDFGLQISSAFPYHKANNNNDGTMTITIRKDRFLNVV